MAIRRSRQNENRNLLNSRDKGTRRQAVRKQLLENLEERRLLAIGPQLLGIQPNNGELLESGDVRTVSPRELTFRFDDSQIIDPSTLGGIRITKSGQDESFGLFSNSSGLSSEGDVDVQFTSLIPDQEMTIRFQIADLGATNPPVFALTGASNDLLTVTLNSNAARRTTARELVNRINASSILDGIVSAKVNGGFQNAEIAVPGRVIDDVVLNQTNDEVIDAGFIEVGAAPNQNEVIAKLANELGDDLYRIEVFGFDDPVAGIQGLRAINSRTGEENLFVPQQEGTLKDTIDFKIDLGARVAGVVPQPVTRLSNGNLTQAKDTIVVYFDSDKLFVGNTTAGDPVASSAENLDFYKLVVTNNTVRNTDDVFISPVEAKYHASSNTVTLRFSQALDRLATTGNGEQSTLRLRVGNRETQPLAPEQFNGAATALTDFGSDGAAVVRLSAVELGEIANPPRLRVINSQAGGSPTVSVVGNVVTLDLADNATTVQQAVTALQTDSQASALLTAEFEPGSDRTTVIGDLNRAYSPIDLVGLGSSFDTATSLAVFNNSQSIRSIVVSSSIDPEEFILDLAGANDDAGHTQLNRQYDVNTNFGADDTPGIETIYYNFQNLYGVDSSGNTLNNQLSDLQKVRAREAFGLWQNYLGVQFVETNDLGITIAVGDTGAAGRLPGFQTFNGISSSNGISFATRIDPAYQRSLVVLSAQNAWNSSYGEDFSRSVTAGIGAALGLQNAVDAPESTLMRLDPGLLAGNGPLIRNGLQLNASDQDFEPVYPANQDILHGQFLHRPDGTDIDLYRFEVNLDGDQVGLLTAETFSQRLLNSSPLDTNLQLFKATQATGVYDFGLGNNLRLQFESVRPGSQGNDFKVFFTQTDRSTRAVNLTLFPNAINIDLSKGQGAESRVIDVIRAIENSTQASRLLNVELLAGSSAEVIGANLLTLNPLVLSGGLMELVSQNDDYFSRDSLVRQEVGSGTYFLGVSASGNDEYNASIENSGFGGKSQGLYDVRITFQADVDLRDTIQDTSGGLFDDPAVGFDGDGDGVPGGTYNFWFETRPDNRVINITEPASTALEGRTIRLVSANGQVRIFEFSSDASLAPGRIRIPYTVGQPSVVVAQNLNAAINGQAIGVTATINGTRITLVGERLVELDPALTAIDLLGKTIFVDRLGGPGADGTLAKPFDSIAGSGVPNAFAAAVAGDIVRIVGNGGNDGLLATTDDNLAYEIGFGLLPGQTLRDGVTMEVPRGVTTMIDAGAILKFNRARIGVGSSNLGVDRSGAALQILGAPLLLDSNGDAILDASGQRAVGNVYLNSWLNEDIGFDNYAPRTTPQPGNWGGISYRRDVDAGAGRVDLENQGIFVQYVNYADIQYGGGQVTVDSVQQTVTPIQLLGTRATVTYNTIRQSANAAISALPDSFEETNFHEPRFQASGEFTSDYDRVGPSIYKNTLINNSINGLFIRVVTPADNATETLSVPGRLDDIDIVHVLTENLIVDGSTGADLLDSRSPILDFVSLAATPGGTLPVGTYNYKMTFVDRNGFESVPSQATQSLVINSSTLNAIRLNDLPSVEGDFVRRKIYRSSTTGQGPYVLVAELDGITSSYLDRGTVLGGRLQRDQLDVSGTLLTTNTPGALPAGTYNYRVSMVDSSGIEGFVSLPTSSVTLAASGEITLNDIPVGFPGFPTKRLYRSAPDGQGPYELIATLSRVTANFTDTGIASQGLLPAETLGVIRPQLNASLIADPGIVAKLESARIEARFGSHLIFEGNDELPVVFTSRLDDRFGVGGSFDTNNNGTDTLPQARDWGGIYVGPSSSLYMDSANVSFAGGVTRVQSTFRAFNPIEIHQGFARIANSQFENNGDGFGGQGPGARFDLLTNEQATIFVRGAQPAIFDNEFVGNAGAVITIDANSFIEENIPDLGRQSGAAERNATYRANYGPLVRGNRMENNGLNGMKIRGETLTTASIWDDTDIAHVLFDGIFVRNLQHSGGLRLQSSPTESLVVKFSGPGSNFDPTTEFAAGITALGDFASGRERIGGTIEVLGQPGFPVVLTSLDDDTVGAGLRPNGLPQVDTNNNGIATIPRPGDWRGIVLGQNSNDRNIARVIEAESAVAFAPGVNDVVTEAEVLGDLAANLASGNENVRGGFVAQGVLSQPSDVDVYSFSGVAGTQIWLDVDHTKSNLDLVLELLKADGTFLARSDSSTFEEANPGLLETNPLEQISVFPLTARPDIARRTSSDFYKEDGTINEKDPGLRIVLPGTPGQRTDYFFRVRSASTDPDAAGDGLTFGNYEVQLRLRELQEFPGSVVNYADIRYATNGVHLQGLPTESPLIGEIGELEGNTTDTFGNTTFGTLSNDSATGSRTNDGLRSEFVGNISATARGGVSIGGELSNAADVDVYRFEVTQQEVLTFDIDFADGLSRADTSVYLFREVASGLRGLNGFYSGSEYLTNYQLIAGGEDSNIADDLRRPLSGSNSDLLSAGSEGVGDAFLGPVTLPRGNYAIAVTSKGTVPRAEFFSSQTQQPLPGVTRPLQESNVLVAGTHTSGAFDLSSYAAEDVPRLYITGGSGTEVIVRESDGTETSLGFVNASDDTNVFELDQFAGQDDLRILVQGNGFLNNLIVGLAERGEAYQTGVDPLLLPFGGLQDLVAPFAGQVAASRAFSLATYSAADAPAIEFDYEVLIGNVDVFINGPGIRSLIATTDPPGVADGIWVGHPGVVILQAGIQTTASVPIQVNIPGTNQSFGLAGFDDLVITFETRDEQHDVRWGDVYGAVGPVFVNGNRHYEARFADGGPLSTFTQDPNVPPPNTIRTGLYQLEIRQSQSPGGTFDSNTRFSDQSTIVAPDGADVADGDAFSLSDGLVTITFEFSTDGSTGFGNIPVRISNAFTAGQVAQRIRDAINSPNVQSRLRISAASSDGQVTGATSNAEINLFGEATFRTILASDPAGEVQLILNSGNADQNIERDQGQILVQNSFVRHARDWGVWSEPGERILQDPAQRHRPSAGIQPGANADVVPLQLGRIDGVAPVSATAGMEAIPALRSSYGAPRNLPVLNSDFAEGYLPGLVVQNNVVEQAGLGGVHAQGQSPLWMVTASQIPTTEPTTTGGNAGLHFGSFVDDGDQLVLDSGRTRLKLEFDDLSGSPAGNPHFGSAAVGGSGVDPDAVPVWYREDAGATYLRPPTTIWGTTAAETLQSIRDSIQGSIFVTNGTSQFMNVQVAPSLNGRDTDAPFAPDAIFYNAPALYIEGLSNIEYDNQPGTPPNPFIFTRLSNTEAPQPHVRVVNNTVIGSDGRASLDGIEANLESNDVIQDAIETWQGTAANPTSYTTSASIGDNAGLPFPASADVDFYQFKLDIGERVVVDVDTPLNTLDSVLRVFDSDGIVQSFRTAAGDLVDFSDNNAAPDEDPLSGSLDPYIDFTATKSGVYYVAVSSSENRDYDPLSLGNRVPGRTTGAYDLSLSVFHPQQFTITVEDASAYTEGETFTIAQISDLDGTTTNERTFEFTFSGAISDPANIPILLDPGYFFPDVAQAIAKAINEGDAGQPALPNSQSLENGGFGLASPLDPVLAIPLGGLNGVVDATFNNVPGGPTALDGVLNRLRAGVIEPDEVAELLRETPRSYHVGLNLMPRRADFVAPFHSGLGIGHDRTATGQIGPTSRGNGTTEKFVVIHNAAFVRSNGNILVDPDENENNNLNQFLPETGILVTAGSSPTIANNVLFNVQTPVVQEETRYFFNTGGYAPYGTTNLDRSPDTRPSESVLTGSIFQYAEPGLADSRFQTGIEQTPTNIPFTAEDLNFEIAAGVRLFESAQGSNFLPANLSPIIDSSVSAIEERPAIAAVKQGIGIGLSSINAPERDAVGQLRIDDPNVAPPSGLGSNVFIDRGALDRSDFIGPAAVLIDPIDNDSAGVDTDNTFSVVQLNSGIYNEFRIQLRDGRDVTDPFKGIGIDDVSVINSEDVATRRLGASVVLFENGVMLTEGIDYRFAYNATRDEIVLTPLAGAWNQESAYEISLNNRDRFVIDAPAGDELVDGQIISIIDDNGREQYFEFDSGFQVQLPQGIEIQVPLAGVAVGGVSDSDLIELVVGEGDDETRVVFELDRNVNWLPENRRIPFSGADSFLDIAQSIFDALVDAKNKLGLEIEPQLLPDGRVFVGAQRGTYVNTSRSGLLQPTATFALRVPELGTRNGGVNDGQTLTVSDGFASRTFEFDNDGVVVGNNTPIGIAAVTEANEVADLILLALENSGLDIRPTLVREDTVRIGLPSPGAVRVDNSQLTLVGAANPIQDGETITFDINGSTTVFEFDNNNDFDAANVRVDYNVFETQETVAERLAILINNANIGLTPNAFRDGNILIGGTEGDSVVASAGGTIAVFGDPGVAPSTSLEIIGGTILAVPSQGGQAFTDNTTMTITGPNGSQVFEFDGNFSGASDPANRVIRFSPTSTPLAISKALAGAINASNLGITARDYGDRFIDLGSLAQSQVDLGNSAMQFEIGKPIDGETFTISNQTESFVFEFDNVSLNNGVTLGNVPILFSDTSTRAEIFEAMKAAIEVTSLGLLTNVEADRIVLLDSPDFVTDTSNAPSINRIGFPGGPTPVEFVKDQLFTAEDVARSIVRAINSRSSILEASIRGNNTLFVENAIGIISELDSYSLRAIEDLAGNDLRANRVNNDTRFTILMPGAELDYGDAPDPAFSTLGRYPTLRASDGARHVVTLDGPRLGSDVTLTGEPDGSPDLAALADAGDDGVVFTSTNNPLGVFNKSIETEITVTATGEGFLDAWVDFNADGDWDDVGEQIAVSIPFDRTRLVQTISVTVPSVAPNITSEILTFARFRYSSLGGLLPSGLAIDGEVEDYQVRLVPGTPPVAIDDNYTIDEDDPGFTTTDATGQATANFTIDDGILANDEDAEGGTFSAILLTGPSNGALNLNQADGTFTYRPDADFYGTDTFTYRVSDGVLLSNNIGTVTINVRPVNDRPIAGDHDVTIDEDQAYEVATNELLAIDRVGPDNEANPPAGFDAQTLRLFSIDSVSQRGGSVSRVGGIIRYVPPTDFAGTDTFSYVIEDDGITGQNLDPLRQTVTVTLTVRDKNDAPTTGDDQLTVREDQSITRNANFFLQNDSPGPSAESGQTLTLTAVDPVSTNGGTVTFANGQVTYTPAQNFSGVDTFFYTVTDNGTSEGQPDPQSSTGTVTVTVTGENDAPIVQSPMGTIRVDEDANDVVINLRNVFFDPDVATSNDTLSYRVVSNSNSSLATAAITGNSNLNVALLPDANGQATIVVEARDRDGLTVQDTLTLIVNPVEDSPRLVTPVPDQNIPEDGGPVSIEISPRHIFDPDVVTDGDTLTLAVTLNTNPGLVTAEIDGGNLVVDFAPNQIGRATIRVTGTDSNGNEVSDTLDIVVTPVNDGPIAQADAYRVPQGETLVANDRFGTTTSNTNDNGVLANDSDDEGDSFTAELVRDVLNGTLSLQPDGTFTYTPDGTAGTSDSFTYRTVDARGAIGNTVEVTIEIDLPIPPSHQNPDNQFDVDANGRVTPRDALLVINFLNKNGVNVSVDDLPPPPEYLDVDGNDIIRPADALQVINFLNRQSVGGEGEGEGEGFTITVGPQTPGVFGSMNADRNPAFREDVSQMAINPRVRMGQATHYGPQQDPGAGVSNREAPLSLADALAMDDSDKISEQLSDAMSVTGSESSVIDQVFSDLFND